MLLIAILLAAAPLAAQVTDAQRGKLLAAMDDSVSKWGAISRRIWEFAELGYHENKSSQLLQDELRAAGFGAPPLPTGGRLGSRHGLIETSLKNETSPSSDSPTTPTDFTGFEGGCCT